MAYATIQDVRDFGVSTTDASDARVTRALARATATIDDFTGRVFGVAETKTLAIDGVYSGMVPLPAPFSTITAVKVAGVELDSDQYSVRDYGLVLNNVRIRDADGFPLYWSAARLYPRIAVTVEVSATFGTTDIPPAIVDATVMLAAGYARLRADDALPAAAVGEISSGGVRVVQRRTGGPTTGNLEVDQILETFQYFGRAVQ